MIISHQNPFVKSTLRLRRFSKQRRQQGLFLVDGLTEIRRAIEANILLESIIHSASLGAQARELAAQSDMSGKLVEVSAEILSRLSYGERDEELVAIAQSPEFPLSNLELTPRSLVLVLDRTEKPGNLGACLRTAVCCSVDAVVLTQPICEVLNPNVIRASRAAVFQSPLAICEVSELREHLKKIGIPIHCARTDGASNLWDLDLTQGAALVFGNEAQGLGREWREADSFVISMGEQADSLNLATSAAVSLYEARRQLRTP